MKRILIIILCAILAALALSSCTVEGDPGEDGSNVTPIEGGWDDATTDTPLVTISNPHGKAEKGPFEKDSPVFVYPLNDLWSQVGPHVKGYTESNDGSYRVYADITSPFGRYEIDGSSYNEVEDRYDWVRLRLRTRHTEPEKNINPLTMLQDMLSEQYFHDPQHECYRNGDLCLSIAKTEILGYFQEPSVTSAFSEMTLQGDSTADAVLSMVSSIIAAGRTGPEQNDFMREISIGILQADQVLKQVLYDASLNFSILDVKRNLTNKFAELEIDATCPPFWRLDRYPDYYEDLLDRSPISQLDFNLDDNTTCNFDQSTFNLYAVPFVFASGIETSRYIALNFPADADISIWSRGVHAGGYIAPGVKVLDITHLKENLLDSDLSYHGKLPDNHGLTSGSEYYFRIRKDTDFVLSKACGGERVVNAYTLASDDEGLTWIGDGNNADKFFYFEGVKMEGWN